MDVSFAEVFDHYYGEYGINTQFGWARMKCPFHDDRTASAAVNFDEGRFYCHACGVSEDALGLIMKMENCDFVTAKRIASERFGGREERVAKPRRRKVNTARAERRIHVRSMGTRSGL